MVHLHVHSMFSLRDSIIKPDELMTKLQQLGQTAVAITDHGNSLGGVSIYKLCKSAGIKYIHGCEMYICDDVAVKDKDNKYSHLIVLCKNDAGRLNLNTLMSISELPDNGYYKPRIDFNILRQHKDGLIVCSACLAGELAKRIQNDDYDGAFKIAKRYKEEFGGDYYIEIQAHRDETQMLVNTLLVQIADELDIPIIVTTDAHYIEESDQKYQSKHAFGGAYKEDSETYLDCFIQSEAEVRERLSYFSDERISEFIANTQEIADKCNVDMPLSAPIMPKVETPPEFANNKAWLEHLCMEGFKTKLGYSGSKEDRVALTPYFERYEYELRALEKMGFIDYILLVYSYANQGKRRGIARGSGGGCLINYLTNITDIDPLLHGLYFERFVDVGALEKLDAGEITAKELKVADIDLDFSYESCQIVMDFLYKTYGEDRVASIGEISTNQTKGTIRDMCKAFNFPLEQEANIARAFDGYELEDIDQMLDGEMPITPGASAAIAYVRQYPELFEYVRKLKGLPKAFGKHACGKIISTKPLNEFLPSCYDSDGIRYLQGDMHDVEDVGLVKIDVLGLRTLDQEYDTLEQSGESIEFLNPRQDYGDDKVLDIFRSGDTVGIFQMSSYGMKQTLKKMNVSGIEDLSIANALYRPGAVAYIDNFCNRRTGKEQYEYLHPDLEPILKNTYGILVFQEQLIEIGRMAGIKNPDLLRKATGKKDIKLLNQIQPELHDKLIERGWTDEQFNKLWEDMLAFARYSFNKAHSSAYAIISYMTAKQKAYYPVEFYAGLCNSYLGKSDYVQKKADEIISDAYAHGVCIAPFDYKQDHRRCNAVDGKLIYGIPLILNCNEAVANAVYEAGQDPPKMFWQLLKFLYERGVDKAQAQILILLGFFRDYGNTRELLRIKDMLAFFKDGKALQIKKDRLANHAELENIVKCYATDISATTGKELKSYTIIDIESILTESELLILASGIEDVDIKTRLANQQQYLGFSPIASGKEDDRPYLVVFKMYPACKRADGKQFGWSVVAASLGSGKQTRYTIFNNTYNENPVKEGDIILVLGYSTTCKDGVRYYNINNYKKVG